MMLPGVEFPEPPLGLERGLLRVVGTGWGLHGQRARAPLLLFTNTDDKRNKKHNQDERSEDQAYDEADVWAGLGRVTPSLEKGGHGRWVGAWKRDS
jgi:hypothetical protein